MSRIHHAEAGVTPIRHGVVERTTIRHGAAKTTSIPPSVMRTRLIPHGAPRSHARDQTSVTPQVTMARLATVSESGGYPQGARDAGAATTAMTLIAAMIAMGVTLTTPTGNHAATTLTMRRTRPQAGRKATDGRRQGAAGAGLSRRSPRGMTIPIRWMIRALRRGCVGPAGAALRAGRGHQELHMVAGGHRAMRATRAGGLDGKSRLAILTRSRRSAMGTRDRKSIPRSMRRARVILMNGVDRLRARARRDQLQAPAARQLVARMMAVALMTPMTREKSAGALAGTAGPLPGRNVIRARWADMMTATPLPGATTIWAGAILPCRVAGRWRARRARRMSRQACGSLGARWLGRQEARLA